jgi:hypothetical protein
MLMGDDSGVSAFPGTTTCSTGWAPSQDGAYGLCCPCVVAVAEVVTGSTMWIGRGSPASVALRRGGTMMPRLGRWDSSISL